MITQESALPSTDKSTISQHVLVDIPIFYDELIGYQFPHEEDKITKIFTFVLLMSEDTLSTYTFNDVTCFF